MTGYKEPDILILGAGPAGLTAGFELARGGRICALIEREERAGGLSRTLRCEGFLTDIGPHRFFSQNKSLYGFIGGLLNERWIEIERLTRFYINGRFYRYPINLKELLIKMERGVSLKIAVDFLFEKAKHLILRKTAVSFEDKVVADFGRTLAEIVMLGYTEKIWGLPCSQISSDWITQRIKNLSIRELLRNSLFSRKNAPKTLVDRFFYPDAGIGLLFESMQARIESVSGNRFLFNSLPVKLVNRGRRIEEIFVLQNGRRSSFKPGNVISSIPITELTELMDPSPSREILEASRGLKFRSHVSLFITLDKDRVTDNQWIYFPDRNVPFGRVMEPRNWSAAMAPVNKTSLLVEFFCWHNDEVWNASAEALAALALPELEKSGLVRKREVRRYFVHRERYAYPVYDLQYQSRVEILKEYFAGFRNLRLIGRGGRFRYNNMDHAMETGILAAKSILEDKSYDLDAVGSEQAYFERGELNAGVLTVK